MELQNSLCGPNVMILTPIEFFAGPHNLLGFRGPAKNLNGRQKRGLGPNGVLQFPRYLNLPDQPNLVRKVGEVISSGQATSLKFLGWRVIRKTSPVCKA